MSRPVGSASSNAVEVNFNEVENEPIGLEARKEPQRAETQVEPWSGHRPLTFNEPEFKTAMSTGQELAAQLAREAAARKEALKTLSSLQAPLAQMGANCPDPEAEFQTKDAHVFRKALHNDAFTKAAATLTPADFRAVLHEQVKNAWPESTPAQQEKLKQYFMGEIGHALRTDVAPQLQQFATKLMDETSKDFAKTAADPARVQQLATRLTEMANPLADPADQSVVRDLRAGFGLDLDEVNVTPAKLTVALNERAALLKSESRKMDNHAHSSVYRALADQEVGPLFMQKNGVQEGSLLAAQIDQVKAQGQSEDNVIAVVKLASVVTAGVFTGGLALGGAGIGGTLAGVGISASMATPGVVHAWEAVGTAQASESAGTMRAGAGEDAQRHAVLETGAAVASIGIAQVANAGMHGALHASNDLVKALSHGAVEFGAEKLTEGAAHAISGKFAAKGDATGRNALERAKP